MPEILRTLHGILPDAAPPSGDDFDALQDIDRALVPVYIFDAESHAILAANTAALQLYGYSEEEFLRLTLYDLRPQEEMERLRRFLRDGWPQGLKHCGAWWHRAKNGRVFTVNVMGLRIVRARRPAILAIITDLTQTVRLPQGPGQSGGALFPFAEEMGEVCWIRSLDDDRYVYLSPAFERVTGLSRESIYAEAAAILRPVHEDDIEAVLRYRQAQTQGPAKVEYRIRCPDGSLRWLASRSFPLRDAAGARMAAGAGCGLQLIRMLLPPQGVRFDLREEDGEVAAILQLAAPAIEPRA